MSDRDEAAVRPIPTHAELERALTSVPGVEEAHVTVMPETGKSRLRIRLSNAEDAPTVSWAIAATLRERFGIVLDPEAIRPRLSAEGPTPAEPPADDRDDEVFDPDEADDTSVVVVGDRVMLSEAAREVLAEVVRHGAAGEDEASDVEDVREVLDALGAVEPPAASAPPADHPGPWEHDVHAGAAGAGAADAGDEELGEVPPLETPAPRGAENDRLRLVTADPHAQVPEPPRAAAEGEAAGPADTAPGAPAEGAPPGGDDEVAKGPWPPPAWPSPEPAPAREADAAGPAPGAAAGVGPDSGARASHRRSWRGPTERPDAGRAAIRHLDTRVDVSDVQVTATLSHRGRTATGRARSVPTHQGILRAVAEATVAALRELTGERFVIGVDSVTASVTGDPPIATVLVSVITDRGEEELLGASLVRQDPERAVMRATLDALNRRAEPWLEVDLAG